MMPVKLLVVSVLLANLVLPGCATDNPDAKASSEESSSGMRAPNRAIDMRTGQDKASVYSLYGIELGESRDSISEKYELVACREGVYFLRCAVSLDTRGVDGIIPDDKTTVFITLRDNRVHGMSVPVFAPSLEQVRDALVRFHGPPASSGRERNVWLNQSGAIILERGLQKGHPSIVTYLVNEGQTTVSGK